MSQLVAECVSAEFSCSLALQREEFLRLVGKVGRQEAIRTRGLAEFYMVVERLKVRALGKPEVPPIKWSDANKRLLYRPGSGECPEVVVTSLSPSDSSISLALQQFRDLLPKNYERRKSVVACGPNHSAVVLLVQVADHAILLGADLEETEHPGTGWTVIVDSPERPQVLSSVFKVPHHGSVNADQPRVWSDMLVENPVAVLTPFRRGTKLPSEEDKARICGHTREAYSTASTKPLKQARGDRVADKIIKDTVKSIREIEGQVGHIRLRRFVGEKDSGKWDVELVEPAQDLCRS